MIVAKSWKACEKHIAQWWNDKGVRAIRTSHKSLGTEVEDIELPDDGISIEVKTRKTTPTYLTNWMAQATRNAGALLPVVHLHRDNAHTNDDYIIMTVESLYQLLERSKCKDAIKNTERSRGRYKTSND